MSQTNDTKTHDTTRRDFLKTGSAAGLSLAGGLSLARSAHAQGSDELTFVLIGCGGRGTGAAVNNLSSCKGTKLIAVADAFEDRAKGSLGQIKRRHEDQVDVPDDRVFSGFDAYKNSGTAEVAELTDERARRLTLVATGLALRPPPGDRNCYTGRALWNRRFLSHGDHGLRLC